MTIRNLDPCFRPRSIAIVGASNKPNSVGSIVLGNIRKAGFAGAIYPINPKYREIDGLRCFASAADLPEAPDLAMIVTPPTTVPKVVADLAARGCRAAVVITAGVGKADGLRQAMLDAAKPHLMRIVGPNTIGMLSPVIALNASFAPTAPRAGGLGLISQSGAILTSIVDWAAAEGVGFSQLVSLGDMSDVDVGDCLNWLAADPLTKSILIYLESVPSPRKFMSAARAAARVKPVIAIKPGRHEQAAKAAMTHTGALAGADNVIDAALRRAGVIRVRSIEELFYAAEITSSFAPLRSGRVGIVTNGGGAGVLAVDDILDLGGKLAELTEETIVEIGRSMPSTWSHGNPVDIIGDAPPERYHAAIAAVARDPGVDVVLAMNCPTALASPIDAARAAAALATNGLVNGKPLIGCWLGKEMAEPARAILRQAGVATADTPAAAGKAVSLLTEWSRLRERLQRVPANLGQVAGDRARVHQILASALAEGRRILTEPEAKAVLAAYGIPTPEIAVATTPAEVRTIAARLLKVHDAVVVKLYSKTITHKSDLGGVALNLSTPEAAESAALKIQRNVEAKGATGLDGFVVQPMIRRSHAHEVLLGLASDPGFGPVLLFGAGGTAVEVLRDSATGLVPLDDVLAGDLIDATRIGKLLAGYRDRPPVDRPALIGAILALSQLAVDHPGIVAVDINPLLVDEKGLVALDARVELDPARAGLATPNPLLAVRPYPTGWEHEIELAGRRFYLRPIKPADAELYPDFLAKVTPEDMRLRFLVPTPTLSQETLVRLSQLDYDRDIAFVALDQHDGKLAGISRFTADPDRDVAEFGILVRSDLQGQGLGSALLTRLIDYARADGIKRLVGMVLRENANMLDLSARMGFRPVEGANHNGIVEVSLPLA